MDLLNATMVKTNTPKTKKLGSKKTKYACKYAKPLNIPILGFAAPKSHSPITNAKAAEKEISVTMEKEARNLPVKYAFLSNG